MNVNGMQLKGAAVKYLGICLYRICVSCVVKKKSTYYLIQREDVVKIHKCLLE